MILLKKTKGIRLLFCAVLTVASLLSCLSDNDDNEIQGANIQVGDALPSFSITLSDGTKINDETLKNKVSLILFFNTTCPDCTEQLPVIEELYREMGDEEDVLIYAVSRSQAGMFVEKYWNDNGYTIPYSAQSDVYIYSLFAKTGVPRIYIADKNKVVRYMYDDNPIADKASLRIAIGRLLNSGFYE